MRPTRLPLLDHTGYAGGFRRLRQPTPQSIVDDGVMSPRHRVLKEGCRVRYDAGSLTTKCLHQELDGDVGGDLSVEVSAHAIGGDEQNGITAVRVADAIFVLGPPALPALLIHREFHGRAGRPATRSSACRTFPRSRPTSDA